MKKVHTILVIEDDHELQLAIGFKLKQVGWEPWLVGSAEEGLKLLESRRPNLIWLDLLLPGMGGLQFLEAIRQRPAYRDLPVVIASVLNDPARIKKAFELNVIDYVVKSERNLNDVVAAIQTYFQKTAT